MLGLPPFALPRLDAPEAVLDRPVAALREAAFTFLFVILAIA
jgi:hypothetical protein